MLPAPVLSSRRKHRDDARRRIPVDRALLMSRSRLTNLGVLLLSATLGISLLLNIKIWVGRRTSTYETRQPNDRSSIESTITRDAFSKIDHLIIVAGHAVWKGCSPEGRLDDLNWILEERQKGGGNVVAYFNHIEEGARLMLSDPMSLLIFSGGQTRPKSLFSEAQSYHHLASSSGILDSPSAGSPGTLSPSKRVATENFALDSYQNLLFSIARFNEVTGHFPKKITVVGFGIKRNRFEELHRHAIRWPGSQFSYVGLDGTIDKSIAQAGENQFGFQPYSKDLYGCHGELLEKRRRRNPFQIYHPYHVSTPELSNLLNWCPSGNDLFEGPLPWI